MHAVVETPTYLASAKAAGLSDSERSAIVETIAADPTIGDVMVGAGGARKFRFAGRGRGKSGGYRVVTFYAGDDIPVFLLDVFGKGEKANLSKAERNEFALTLAKIAATYRRAAQVSSNH